MFTIPIGVGILGTITGIGTLVGDGIRGMALIGVGVGTLGMVQIGAGDGIIGTVLTGDGMVGMEILGTIIIMRTEEGTDCMEDIQMVKIVSNISVCICLLNKNHKKNIKEVTRNFIK